jgi:predicted metal-binding protein
LIITRIDFDWIAFQPSDDAMRTSCTQSFAGHEDGCPNYGKTWSCPPNCPSLDEMKARLGDRRAFYIIQLQASLPANYKKNAAKMKDVQVMYKHMDETLEACLDALVEKMPGAIALFASPCNVCEKEGIGSCTCPDVPCRDPSRMHYSLSSHGIDTFATMVNAGISVETNPETTVSRIGMLCTKEDVNIVDIHACCLDKMD